MTVWVEYSIDELMDVQNGYAFKSGEYIEEGSNTFEVLKMGHIEKGGGLRKSPKKDYVPRTEKLGRWVLSKDDIVMAMTDMKDNVVILGVPARIDRSDHYVLNQRVARLTLKNPNLVDIGFIYSYLKWEDFLFELQSKASSGVQVNLSTSTIKESILRVPPLPEQKAIASVLSSLDDKIDLLHRQNKTLEAIDLLPSFSTSLNLVKSVLEKENGLEEAIYRRADHWIFEAGRGRGFSQRAMPSAWIQ